MISGVRTHSWIEIITLENTFIDIQYSLKLESQTENRFHDSMNEWMTCPGDVADEEHHHNTDQHCCQVCFFATRLACSDVSEPRRESIKYLQIMLHNDKYTGCQLKNTPKIIKKIQGFKLNFKSKECFLGTTCKTYNF